jgi:ubiquinone/menaquinone biosynthesis C-methylase UbiE
MNRTDKTKVKYFGNIAAGYEAKRSCQDKWIAEHKIISRWIANYPDDIRLLDCPVGTGRFLDLYAARCFSVTGIDISADMLEIARSKPASADVFLKQGSIFNITGSYDVSLAIRIMNLIERADMQRALRELQRVTRYEIIFNLRIGEPGRYRNPHPVSAVEAALVDGWRIVENVEIHEPDFRMLRLKNEMA